MRRTKQRCLPIGFAGSLAIAIISIALFGPKAVFSGAGDIETNFLEAEVVIISFNEDVTRFKLVVSGAIVDVRNDIHIRLVDNPYQLPQSFPILAPMTAVTLVQGQIPKSAIHQYPLKYYLSLRDEYDKWAPEILIGGLIDRYFKALDQWVAGGGTLGQIQSEVVENCGKLVMLHATEAEQTSFMTTQRDEFDFRVDVCTKITVNRVHPQPEFDNPKITTMICDESQLALFKKLCWKSGLR